MVSIIYIAECSDLHALIGSLSSATGSDLPTFLLSFSKHLLNYVPMYMIDNMYFKITNLELFAMIVRDTCRKIE